MHIFEENRKARVIIVASLDTIGLLFCQFLSIWYRSQPPWIRHTMEPVTARSPAATHSHRTRVLIVCLPYSREIESSNPTWYWKHNLSEANWSPNQVPEKGRRARNCMGHGWNTCVLSRLPLFLRWCSLLALKTVWCNIRSFHCVMFQKHRRSLCCVKTVNRNDIYFSFNFDAAFTA